MAELNSDGILHQGDQVLELKKAKLSQVQLKGQMMFDLLRNLSQRYSIREVFENLDDSKLDHLNLLLYLFGPLDLHFLGQRILSTFDFLKRLNFIRPE